MSLTPESMPDMMPESVDPALFREGNPWRVVTDLNELCNAQCNYCHIDALYGPKAKDARVLPPEVAAQVLQSADEMQVFDATLTGGEITTLPNFSDYLEPIDKLKFTSVQVISNGTRITPALASELADVGVKRVSISIDGPEESNDAARGAGMYRRALRGVRNAVAAGLNVNVISVLGQHNIDTWDQLPPMLKDEGVRSQNLSLMCRLGRAELADEWPGVPEDRVDEVRGKALRMQALLNDASFSMFLNDGVLQAPGWSGQPTPLHAFQDRNPGIETVVKVDGSVLRNRLYGKEPIGNVHQATLREIWAADRAKRQTLQTVVGEENYGALPSLYHHFGEANVQEAAPAATSQTEGGALRIRQEEWGTVTFNTDTFTIDAITAHGRAS